MFQEQYESNQYLPANTEDIVHLESLQLDFSSLFNQKDDHDVVFFSLEGEPIFAHKSICSCRSEYLNKMLYLDDINEFQVNFKYNILYHIINYLYTGKIEIQKEEVMDLCSAADKFKLRRLKNACFDFLLNNVTKDSVCKLVMDCLSKKYDFKTDVLVTKCMIYIEKNTTDVFEGEEYLKFSEEFLIKLIKSSKISIEEQDLFKSLVKWGKKRVTEEKSLKIVLQNLVKHIRFTRLSADFLVSFVKPLNVISLMTYAEALEYNISPQDAHITNKEDVRGSTIKFTWDSSKAISMNLSNQNLTCTKTTTNSWNQARMIGTKQISSGKHYWEVSIDHLNINDKSGMVIGITTANNTKYSQDYAISVEGQGYKIQKNSKALINQGDRVGVLVDMNQLTIDFYVNGNSIGYTGLITQQVYFPVVYIYYAQDSVTLKFPPSPKP